MHHPHEDIVSMAGSKRSASKLAANGSHCGEGEISLSADTLKGTLILEPSWLLPLVQPHAL